MVESIYKQEPLGPCGAGHPATELPMEGQGTKSLFTITHSVVHPLSI